MEQNLYRPLPPDIWGGIECTINRVNDSFFDQLDFAGHYNRENDIDLVASLRISALRFPVLWEKHQPDMSTPIDWSWAEKQLNKLSTHGITPVTGLLHHGSGPAFTSLADKKFPDLFAQYAGMVAERFPFIKYYTPINEPLTTARFSGLYGHWYPHRSNALAFARMFFNQAKGIVMAMQRIKEINKHACLVQTEDLGKTYSTSVLKYQANFENERRWLTFDLLAGKVDEKHMMWKYFKNIGIDERTLSWFRDNTCQPSVLGINHYVTSERFLDHNIKKYPGYHIGGNGRHSYVDIDAIRVEHKNAYGLEMLLKEAWERYQIPLAITEIQLNCYREHQLRWFQQAYDACTRLNKEGVQIKAITAWALFGAYGWNQLVTAGKGAYESGVFDLRTGQPRATALYKLIRTLINGETKNFPVISEPGWWQMNNRFIIKKTKTASLPFSQSTRSKPILIVGKNGTLGSAFSQVCEQRALSYRLTSRDEMDITDESQVAAAIEKYKPWAIINASGFVRVDDAETETEKCYRENVQGPQLLAGICKTKGIGLVTFSSDLVFNGEKKNPYLESDNVYPLNVYGQSKAKGERAVLDQYNDALIIRTSAFFGPWDKYNFVYNVLQSLKAKQHFSAVHDIMVSPTYVPDLANATLDLLIDEEKNIWHLSNAGSITWADLAREVAQRGGCDPTYIQSQPLSAMSFRAARPAYSVLKSERGIHLPTLENALERYFCEKCIG